VNNFRTYFQDAVSKPKAGIRSYLIRSDESGRAKAYTDFLTRNGIEWGYATGGSAVTGGILYDNGKAENLKASAGDIVVPALQPRGNLLSVLMERSSKLSDSATYDITAWSLPFVYGLQAYACKEAIAYSAQAPASKVEPWVTNAYAYAIPWTGMSSAQCLSKLTKAGIRVRYAEQPFSAGGRDFESGSLLITKAANQQVAGLEQKIQEITKASGTTAVGLRSGFMDKGFDLGSDRVRIIHVPKVAVITGSSVSSLALGEVWHFFDQQLQYPLALLSEQQFLSTAAEYNVLILADGNYDLLSDKNRNDALKSWVRAGGKIIALEGAVAQLARAEWGIKLKGSDDKAETKEYELLKKYEHRERDGLSAVTPGSIYRVGLDRSHPLAYGYPDYYYTLRQDVNLYEFMKEGWNVGYLKKDDYVAGFAGVKAKDKLKDGLLFGVQELGRGQVVYLADDLLFRSFWENGKLMFCNALFMVGQ
jgi:hypothetical protein